ncbi:MAG: diguanylate cyclase, partial [Anaerolineae bacterium]
AIMRAERENLRDPRSGLPSGRLIEDQLRRIIRLDDWAFMDVRINHFEPFKEVYGFVAGDDVLRFTAMLLGEVVDELGTPDDFIGHAGGDNFVIITAADKAEAIRTRLKERFAEEVKTQYNFIDREQGYIMASDENGQLVQTPLMTLAVGVVSPQEYAFADIREITELAAEARRKDAVTS